MNGRKIFGKTSLSLKGLRSVNLHFGESFLTRVPRCRIADEYVWMVEKPMNVTVLISKHVVFF